MSSRRPRRKQTRGPPIHECGSFNDAWISTFSSDRCRPLATSSDIAEYASTLLACDIRGADHALAALPLYHSPQMHVFLMPQLLVGATTLLIQQPAA